MDLRNYGLITVRYIWRPLWRPGDVDTKFAKNMVSVSYCFFLYTDLCSLPIAVYPENIEDALSHSFFINKEGGDAGNGEVELILSNANLLIRRLVVVMMICHAF